MPSAPTLQKFRAALTSPFTKAGVTALAPPAALCKQVALLTRLVQRFMSEIISHRKCFVKQNYLRSTFIYSVLTTIRLLACPVLSFSFDPSPLCEIYHLVPLRMGQSPKKSSSQLGYNAHNAVQTDSNGKVNGSCN